MPQSMDFIEMLGLALLLTVFWGGALINLFNWNIAKTYAESQGATLYSSFVLAFGIFWQLVGGALLLKPSTAELGCILLILFTVTSSLQFNQFWKKEGLDRYISCLYFLSNIGVVGGLLLLTAQIHNLKFPFNLKFFGDLY